MNSKKTSEEKVFLFGSLPISCLMADSDSFNNFIFRLNIGIKLFQPPVHKMPQSPFVTNDRKNRRKADKLYLKLFKMVVEIHKLCFNIHYMMAQLEVNEWGLTVQEFNHLFHEVRDGSWDLPKLLDETLSRSETFRKYVLILDVYAKVFVDDFFTNWSLIAQNISDRKRLNLTQDLIAFLNNFCGIKGKYEHLKSSGYIPKLPVEEIKRHYSEKKRQYFESKQRSVSPTTARMLREVFGDEFYRANFQKDGEVVTQTTFTLNSTLNRDTAIEDYQQAGTSLLLQRPNEPDIEISDELDIDERNIGESDELDIEVSDELDIDERNIGESDELDIEVSDELDIDERNIGESDELDIEVSDELDIDERNIEVSDELDIDEMDIDVSEELDIDERDIEVSDELDIDERDIEISHEMKIEISDEPETKRRMWARVFGEYEDEPTQEETKYLEEPTPEEVVEEKDSKSPDYPDASTQTPEFEGDDWYTGSCNEDKSEEEYFTGIDE